MNQPRTYAPDSAGGRNHKVAYTVVCVAVLMCGLSFAAVPLYRMFCQATGFGGTPMVADAAPAVIAKMRELPINDFMTTNGRLREDGRVIRDMYLMRAKTPAQSRGEWDLLEVAETIPGDQAYRPLSESECPLVRR